MCDSRVRGSGQKTPMPLTPHRVGGDHGLAAPLLPLITGNNLAWSDTQRSILTDLASARPLPSDADLVARGPGPWLSASSLRKAKKSGVRLPLPAVYGS